jgi:hypothetical protein
MPVSVSSACKTVPWTTWSEWRSVYNALFSSDRSERARAVTRVRTWSERGRTPRAVLSTAELVAAQDAAAGEREERTARLVVGMAVVRMVNSTVDPWQRAYFALSVQRLALQLHLPRMLVDLRHAASHADLPSLAVLLPAAAVALRWLDEWYWQPQAYRAEHTRDEISQLVCAYRDDAGAVPSEAPALRSLLKVSVAAAIAVYAVPALLTLNCLVPDALLARAPVSALPHELVVHWRPLLHAFHRQFGRELTASLLHALADRAIAVADRSPSSALPTVAASATVALCTAWFTFILSEPELDLEHAAPSRARPPQQQPQQQAPTSSTIAPPEDEDDVNDSVAAARQSSMLSSDALLSPTMRLCVASDGFWPRAILKALLTLVPHLSCPDEAKRRRMLKVISVWEQGSGERAVLPSVVASDPTLDESVAPAIEFLATSSAVSKSDASAPKSSMLQKMLAKRNQSGATRARHELTVEQIAATVAQRRAAKAAAVSGAPATATGVASQWHLCPPSRAPLGMLPNGLPSDLDLPVVADRASVLLRPVIVSIPEQRPSAATPNKKRGGAPLPRAEASSDDDDDDEEESSDDGAHGQQAKKRARTIALFDFASPNNAKK